MGEKKQAKGGGGGRQRRQAPPSGTTAAEVASAAQVQPPAVYLFGWDYKCRLRFSRGDARGEAPCIRKQKISPFPTGEGGWGDRGRKRQAKGGGGGRQRKQAPPSGTTVAEVASAAQGQAPHCVFHSGRDSQCRAGSAIHCVFHSGGDSQCRVGASPTMRFPQRQG